MGWTYCSVIMGFFSFRLIILPNGNAAPEKHKQTRICPLSIGPIYNIQNTLLFPKISKCRCRVINTIEHKRLTYNYTSFRVSADEILKFTSECLSQHIYSKKYILKIDLRVTIMSNIDKN